MSACGEGVRFRHQPTAEAGVLPFLRVPLAPPVQKNESEHQNEVDGFFFFECKSNRFQRVVAEEGFESRAGDPSAAMGVMGEASPAKLRSMSSAGLAPEPPAKGVLAAAGFAEKRTVDPVLRRPDLLVPGVARALHCKHDGCAGGMEGGGVG